MKKAKDDVKRGKRWEMARTVVSGSVGGMASTLVCHPLDTIRTRLQASTLSQSSLAYRGALDCAITTVREEGVRALYKGMAGPLLAQGVYKAVMFGSFKFASENLVEKGNSASTAYSTKISNWFRCGVFAGVMNSLFVCPVELVRNRLMVQRGTGAVDGLYFKGTWDCVKQTVKSDSLGIFGLWRGLGSTILRDGPGVGMWFTCFQLSKELLPSLVGWEDTSTGNLLVSGALGGTGFWLVALPFDTIKSNVQIMQSGKMSMADIVKKIGWRNLYAGFHVAILRGIPGAGIVFFAQSRTLQVLENVQSPFLS